MIRLPVPKLMMACGAETGGFAESERDCAAIFVVPASKAANPAANRKRHALARTNCFRLEFRRLFLFSLGETFWNRADRYFIGADSAELTHLCHDPSALPLERQVLRGEQFPQSKTLKSTLFSSFY